MTSFVEKTSEAQIISKFPSRRLKFTRIYDDFKARLESTNSAEKLQMHYQRLLKSLDNLGEPVAVVNKSIATQLSTLTGKIYMHISRIGEGVGQILPLEHINNYGSSVWCNLQVPNSSTLAF